MRCREPPIEASELRSTSQTSSVTTTEFVVDRVPTSTPPFLSRAAMGSCARSELWPSNPNQIDGDARSPPPPRDRTTCSRQVTASSPPYSLSTSSSCSAVHVQSKDVLARIVMPIGRRRGLGREE
ncbi:hypothetical protein M6B38_389325 [Iris pallida]|uniref:Uncharacterized protein n=1 Tax=Iris pallida TaxID=29817 RepID=A0AAX6G2K4_IRIPA|nr:hypothetical protein M6B38_389325 [Iris pallida]